jgi:hypothetical protein
MEPDRTIPRKGDHVSFHVRDIYLPGSVEFIESMSPDAEVLGCVVDFSGCGTLPGVFAIVQTDEHTRVIVPVNSLLLIHGLLPRRATGAKKTRRSKGRDG